jgi:HEAT repeat protein
MEAINALSGVEDPAALELFKESTAHPKFGVRLISLRGVYKLAPVEEAGPILIGALVDEHPEVRRTVAAYLGWKDFPGAGPALIQCLRDEDANVRKSAVTALASLRDENAVPSLIQTLADSSLEIREKTLDALQSIIGKPVKFDVTATDQDQERAIVSLLEWWNALNSGAEVHAPAEAQEPAEKPAPVQADEIVVEAVAENMQASAAPVQESAISDFGLPEPVTWDGSSESVSSSIDAEAIKDMSKGDLLAYCDKHGIACDPKLTKAEIKKILLGNP